MVYNYVNMYYIILLLQQKCKNCIYLCFNENSKVIEIINLIK